MSSLKDDFKARFPEIPSDTVDAGWPSVDPAYKCYYGIEYGSSSCADEAILNLCAHLLTLSQAKTAAPIKSVTSESAVGVSASYDTGTSSDSRAFFMTTRYGQAFLQISSSRVGGFFV